MGSAGACPSPLQADLAQQVEQGAGGGDDRQETIFGGVQGARDMAQGNGFPALTSPAMMTVIRPNPEGRASPGKMDDMVECVRGP